MSVDGYGQSDKKNCSKINVFALKSVPKPTLQKHLYKEIFTSAPKPSNPTAINQLYKANLEYATPVWSPHLHCQIYQFGESLGWSQINTRLFKMLLNQYGVAYHLLQ